MATILSLKGVSKSYTGKTGGVSQVLDGIDLDVEEGEFIAILGFSGAGKTTLISAIAGLVQPDAGEILLRDQPIDGPGRDRGLVFQSYSLFPWLSVEQNVALAVDAVHKDRSREERAARDLAGAIHPYTQGLLRSLPLGPPKTANDIVAVVGGLGLYVLFVVWAHGFLFGVRPFG